MLVAQTPSLSELPSRHRRLMASLIALHHASMAQISTPETSDCDVLAVAGDGNGLAVISGGSFVAVDGIRPDVSVFGSGASSADRRALLAFSHCRPLVVLSGIGGAPRPGRVASAIRRLSPERGSVERTYAEVYAEALERTRRCLRPSFSREDFAELARRLPQRLPISGALPLQRMVFLEVISPGGPALDRTGGWHRIIDGEHRVRSLLTVLHPRWLVSPGSTPPLTATPAEMTTRAASAVSALKAIAATVFNMFTVVAVWCYLPSLPSRGQGPHTGGSQSDSQPPPAHNGVSSPAPRSLRQAVHPVDLAQHAVPTPLPQHLRIMRRLFTWLSHRGITDAEQRCQRRNAGPPWSSLRQRQHRRCATDQGALAGREPPRHRDARSHELAPACAA